MAAKRKLKSEKKKVGRKWFDGKDEKMILSKLEYAASIDASVGEMCFYADISQPAYFRYCESHKEFRERLDALRERPCLLARETAIAKIPESYSNAIDYLARKKKKEFSP